MQAIDLGGVSAFIGMPVYGRIPPRTAMSLARTLHACGASGIDVDATMEVSALIQGARDMVLDTFLRSDKQKLFWIDSDMVWEREAFFRLLAMSTIHDVVCAAYPVKSERNEFQIFMDLEPQQPTEYGLIKILGTGLGFTVIDRSVCEQVAAKAPRVLDQITGRDMAAAFRVDIFEGKRRSEDIAFLADIRELGHTVWLDPSIALGHIGDRQWNGRAADAFKEVEI